MQWDQAINDIVHSTGAVQRRERCACFLLIGSASMAEAGGWGHLRAAGHWDM